MLMVAAKACESENDGWLVLKHVGPSDRNAEFLMDKKKILVHQKNKINDSDGHYFAYTQEHRLYIFKDLEEVKPKVMTREAVMAELQKITSDQKRYTTLYLTSNSPFDPEQKEKEDKIFGQLKGILEADNIFDDFSKLLKKELASFINVNELQQEDSSTKEGELHQSTKNMDRGKCFGGST